MSSSVHLSGVRPTHASMYITSFTPGGNFTAHVRNHYRTAPGLHCLLGSVYVLRVFSLHYVGQSLGTVERSGSWVEVRTLDYENPGSNRELLKHWASFFTLHCSTSFSCLNEYLAIYSGGYVYEQPSRIYYSIWLDASQRN